MVKDGTLFQTLCPYTDRQALACAAAANCHVIVPRPHTSNFIPWRIQMDEEAVKRQAEIYKVAGVDEDEPALNPAKKRKEAALEEVSQPFIRITGEGDTDGNL